jgi:VIT1/CCC1 family predicted Fe2+/Mn2+ transporter
MANTNYTRGQMEIEGQEDTFSGFMGASVYGGAAIIVTLLFPILVFAVNLAWPAAMATTVILGVIIGVLLKFKAQWYAVLVGTAVLLAILITIFGFFL